MFVARSRVAAADCLSVDNRFGFANGNQNAAFDAHLHVAVVIGVVGGVVPELSPHGDDQWSGPTSQYVFVPPPLASQGTGDPLPQCMRAVLLPALCLAIATMRPWHIEYGVSLRCR